MNRSRLIGLASVALASSALPVRAQSADKLRLGMVGVEESALPFYAVEKGLFKSTGIDVEVTQFVNGGAVTQGLLAGAIDVGVTNSGSMSSAHVRGLPLYMVACGALYSPASPIAHLVVSKSLGIKSAKDLSGKTLGVSTLHDMIQATALEWIQRNGGDPKSVNFAEIPVPQQAAAIAAHRIDGSVMVEPIYTQNKADVQDLGLTYEAVNGGKSFQTLGIIGNKDWVDKNPALAKRVAAVIHQAAKWANNKANHAEATELLAKFTKLDPAIINGYPRLAFAETNNPALIQPVIDLLARYEIIPKAFPASELFAPGLIG
jgi:NitT/TauT family transport system substrate-binding protein